MLQASSSDAQDYLYLLGFTPLADALQFIARESADVPDQQELTARWRAADERRRQMEEAESHWTRTALPRQADDLLQPLPVQMQPLVQQLKQDPVFQRAFAIVTSRIGMVELDPLIVYQRSIHLEHVERLKSQLEPNPSPQALFHFCLPTQHHAPPVRARAVDERSFAFISESTDLRFLEPVLLQGEQMAGYQPPGPVAGVVGLAVGFGSNLLNVIRCENKLILNNGNHRAIALRQMGIDRAPCIVQEVNRREDLRLIAGARLSREADAYLKPVRPPLLRDFFDERLTTRLRLVRRSRLVRVSFTVEEINL